MAMGVKEMERVDTDRSQEEETDSFREGECETGLGIRMEGTCGGE